MLRQAIRSYTSMLTSGDFTTPAVFDSSQYDFTVCGWFKIKFYNNAQVVAAYQTGGSNDCVRANIEAGTGFIFMWSVNTAGSGNLVGKSTIAVPKNKWCRFSFCYDHINNMAYFYIDNVLYCSGSTPSMRSAQMFKAYAGSQNSLASLSIYRRLFSTSDVSADYVCPAIASDYFMHYRLNDGTGNAPIDSGPNGYTGAINAPVWGTDLPMQARAAASGRQLVIRPRFSLVNMIPNGDFEFAPTFVAPTTANSRWIDGTAAGGIDPTGRQYAWSTGGNNFATQFDSNYPHSGRNSLKISTMSAGAYIDAQLSYSGNPSDSRAFLPRVLPGVNYNYAVWMRTKFNSGDSNNGAVFCLFPVDSAGNGISTIPCTPMIKTTTDWTLYTGTYVMPSNAFYLDLKARIYGHTGAGNLIMDAWFDDIQIAPVSAANRLSV